MKIFLDVICNDEVVSDSYKIEDVVDESGEKVPGIFQIDARFITKGDVNVDIGCGNAFGGGEEDDGPADSSAEKVIDLVDGFDLQETGDAAAMSSKDIQTELVTYFKGLRKHRRTEDGWEKEQLDTMMEEAKAIVGFVCKLRKKKALDKVYMTQSFNPSAVKVYSYWKDGAEVPTFLYIRHGLREQNV